MSDSVRPQRRQPTRLPRPWDSPGKNTGVGCHFLFQCMEVKSEREVTQSCPTLHDPIYCSLPGSSVHGIFQARVLEWGAIAFSLRSIKKRELTQRKPLECKTWHPPTTSSTLCRMPHLNNKQNENANPIISRQDYHLTQPCSLEEKQTNKQTKTRTNLTL